AQRERRWLAADEGRGQLLRRATLLVVGYGSIGREVARLAAAFSMRVVAVNTSGTRRQSAERFVERGAGDPEGLIPERVAPVDELPGLAPAADFVVCCLPATPRTTHLVDARLLELLPAHAWVVNVGRPNAIDVAALRAALDGGTIGGAALDVVDQEPLRDHDPLWSAPRLVITPHVAGRGARWDVFTDLAAENLRRYCERRRLLNVVDLEAGY
ncbi:MAG: NAD(P)-dependent oxidoreductase, partial [Gaiellaceae bacterium]